MADELVGRRIIAVRTMTKHELAREGWTPDINGAPAALVLDNGTRLYPSRDPEGNGGGALFGVTVKGATFLVQESA